MAPHRCRGTWAFALEIGSGQHRQGVIRFGFDAKIAAAVAERQMGTSPEPAFQIHEPHCPSGMKADLDTWRPDTGVVSSPVSGTAHEACVDVKAVS